MLVFTWLLSDLQGPLGGIARNMCASIALAGWIHQCGPELTNRGSLVQADQGFEVYSCLQLIQPMVYCVSHVVDLVSSNATRSRLKALIMHYIAD